MDAPLQLVIDLGKSLQSNLMISFYRCRVWETPMSLQGLSLPNGARLSSGPITYGNHHIQRWRGHRGEFHPTFAAKRFCGILQGLPAIQSLRDSPFLLGDFLRYRPEIVGSLVYSESPRPLCSGPNCQCRETGS